MSGNSERPERAKTKKEKRKKSFDFVTVWSKEYECVRLIAERIRIEWSILLRKYTPYDLCLVGLLADEEPEKEGQSSQTINIRRNGFRSFRYVRK